MVIINFLSLLKLFYKFYRVATKHYLATGHDGYEAFEDCEELVSHFNAVLHLFKCISFLATLPLIHLLQSFCIEVPEIFVIHCKLGLPQKKSTHFKRETSAHKINVNCG